MGFAFVIDNNPSLPETVTFSSGAVISYSYAADGTKLRESKTVSGTTTTTDYTGNLVLEDGTRSRMLFDGGYISMSDNAYHFFITDHLGSVRVVASANGVAEEYNHYYPLGGLLPTSTSSTGIQPLKYQGKEWAGSKGLNLYDFGARRYDPATGRWLSPDPLAEKYYSHSPYLFCAANPIRYVDPTGKDDYDFKKNGEWKKTENNDPYDRLIIGAQSLIVKDRSIMGAMKEHKYKLVGQEDESIKNLHYAIIKGESEQSAKQVFKFLADNTNAEWLLLKGGNNSLLLGTQHLTDRIDENSLFIWVETEGKEDVFNQPVYRLHNHPPGYQSEISSMEADYDNYLLTPNTSSFIYFNTSGNLYTLTPRGPQLLKGWKW